MTDNTQLRFALDAVRRGWHIFPCESGEKQGALLYPNRDNAPWRIKWYEAATNDVNQVLSWWTWRPDYNIGVSAKKSSLLIVDCDIPKVWTADTQTDGWEQFQKLCAKRGVDWEDTIDTYQVETPSKGLHLYYEWPPHVHASQASLDTDLDVRSNGGEKGGYVVGAGSKTISGWYHVVNPAPVKQCPAWLVEECRYKQPTQAQTNPFTRPHPISSAGLLSFAAQAKEGSRNDALFWAAAQFTEENPNLDYEDVVNTFMDDAVEVGLTYTEIRGTVSSAYRKVRGREQQVPPS